MIDDKLGKQLFGEERAHMIKCLDNYLNKMKEVRRDISHKKYRIGPETELILAAKEYMAAAKKVSPKKNMIGIKAEVIALLSQSHISHYYKLQEEFPDIMRICSENTQQNRTYQLSRK
ncbi:hypothetical protein GF358_02900 [Candidatus Woesearchaeota archaeon]|nr:hypothetical protein [Candidatus Woesearchaeota archaeon]